MKTILFSLAVFTIACNTQTASLTNADREEIKQLLDKIEGSFHTSDMDRLATVYCDDVTSLPPHGKENSGKQNVVDFHRSGPVTTESFSLTQLETEGRGDIAYTRGTFRFQGSLNDTIKINDEGKYMLILKKESDNAWKVYREMWNSDLPENQ